MEIGKTFSLLSAPKSEPYFEVLFGSEKEEKKVSQILLGFLKKHNLKKKVAIFSQAVLIWSVAHRKEAHEPWQPGNSGKYQLDENPSS